MKLEAGKRYVRRDGKITSLLEPFSDPRYNFFDLSHKLSYTPEGRVWLGDLETPEDLIAEYTEPNKGDEMDNNAQLIEELTNDRDAAIREKYELADRLLTCEKGIEIEANRVWDLEDQVDLLKTQISVLKKALSILARDVNIKD